MTDSQQVQRRVSFYNEFIAGLPLKEAEKYKEMQKRLVESIRRERVQFSMDMAAELIMAVAEHMPAISDYVSEEVME